MRYVIVSINSTVLHLSNTVSIIVSTRSVTTTENNNESGATFEFLFQDKQEMVRTKRRKGSRKYCDYNEEKL